MTTLDVTDYGAVGDGSTDDTAAIQAAIDDANEGDTVYLPAVSQAYMVSTSTPGTGCVTVDGDSHPNDLTLSGDGPDSTIKLADDSDHDSINLFVLRVMPNSTGITGLEIRDLTIDGNRANVGTTGSHSGINISQKDSTAHVDDVDVLVEDVEIRSTHGTGIYFWYGNTRANRVTTDDTGSHGFQISGEHHDSQPVRITNSLATNNGQTEVGRYGFDQSGGWGIVEDSVAYNCQQATKVTDDVTRAEYRRFRGTDSRSAAGFQRPSDVDGADVYWGDTVFENNPDQGLRADGPDTHHIEAGATILCIGNGSDTTNDALFDAGASLDAPDGELYIVDSQSSNDALDWNSSNSGTLDTYAHDGNATNDLGNNGNLNISTDTTARITDIDTVPTASEVGAWSGDSTSDSTTDDSTPADSGFDNWTPRWAGSTADWSVVSGSGYEGDHALGFEADGTDRTRYALSWDEAGTPADVEVLDRFRVPTFTSDSGLGFHARVHLRSSTTNGDENGYWLEVDSPNDAFRLGKYTGGGLTTLARFGSPSEGVYYHRRFRAEGETIRAKVWPASEAEPDAWDAEVTDTDHADGWVGAGSYDVELVETDVFSVGVGGASATLSPGDAAPTVAWVEPTDGATVSGDVSVALDASDSEDADDTLTVEYRVEDGAWQATSYDSSAGTYTATWDSTGAADGGHTLHARVTDSAGNTASANIDVTVDNGTSDDTTDETSLSIDRFDITDNSNPAWSRYDIDWSVSDSDGDLNTVVTELRYGGETVAAESTNVTGETASHSHDLRVKGPVNEVVLSVNDTDNDAVTASKSV